MSTIKIAEALAGIMPADLPVRLTAADDRAGALQRDREREAAGEFNTLQYG